MYYVVRLTRAQLDIIGDCLSFVAAGEIGGGPLCGLSEDDAETQRRLRVFANAQHALAKAKRL